MGAKDFFIEPSNWSAPFSQNTNKYSLLRLPKNSFVPKIDLIRFKLDALHFVSRWWHSWKLFWTTRVQVWNTAVKVDIINWELQEWMWKLLMRQPTNESLLLCQILCRNEKENVIVFQKKSHIAWAGYNFLERDEGPDCQAHANNYCVIKESDRANLWSPKLYGYSIDQILILSSSYLWMKCQAIWYGNT